MWQRLKRVFRSFIGFFISVAEDPELILGQLREDLRNSLVTDHPNSVGYTLAVLLPRAVRAAFEDAAVGMALVAVDGRWLRVNDALCRIVGYSRSELLTRTRQDITHPDDRQRVLKDLKARGMLKDTLVLWNTARAQDEVRHVYLREAARLRPDLAGSGR